MNQIIRIGTRDSELALWQAETVQDKLAELGYKSVLVPVKSDGDLNLSQPLYELGITGIFTKTLDIALINGNIDIAVHSMKDVPTLLPKGIVQAAVLERASVTDVLIPGTDTASRIVATGSLRRKAQWLNRYSEDQITGLRGNVNTRLRKLGESNWKGAIFAKAGLERINLLPDNYQELDWMIPAPAQGAMTIATMGTNTLALEACEKLNDPSTEICTRVEREFLRELEGGCTAPIGAIASLDGEQLNLVGILLSLDGTKAIRVNNTISADQIEGFGVQCAQEILKNGGSELMKEIRKEMNS